MTQLGEPSIVFQQALPQVDVSLSAIASSTTETAASLPTMRMGEPEYRPMTQLGEPSIVLQQALPQVDPLADETTIPEATSEYCGASTRNHLTIRDDASILSANPVIVGEHAPTISNGHQPFPLLPTTSDELHQHAFFEMGEQQQQLPIFEVGKPHFKSSISAGGWRSYDIQHTAINRICFALGRVSYDSAARRDRGAVRCAHRATRRNQARACAQVQLQSEPNPIH